MQELNTSPLHFCYTYSIIFNLFVLTLIQYCTEQGFQTLNLCFEIKLIFKHSIMHGCTNKQEYKSRKLFDRYSEFRRKPLSILGISLVYTFEKFLSVFDVLRMSIDLIHKSVLFAVFLCRPIRNLLDKTLKFFDIFGCFCHKFLFNLCHTMRGRLNYNIVYARKI